MDDTPTNKAKPTRAVGHVPLAPLDHDEYDALADLFLGEGGYAPTPMGRGVGSGREGSQAGDGLSHRTHTPVLHLTGLGDDGALGEDSAAGDGGADDACRPAAAGSRVLETLRATDDRAAELLAALLSGDEAPACGPGGRGEITRGAMPGVAVEVVVLGHLPVRASLWARQYACSCARDRGEVVALIRAAAGTTAVDLVTGGAPVRAPGCADLGSALSCVHSLADRVVMRVDEASEPGLLERPEVGTITILTGADEAAVVASYRLVKTLDASLGELFGEGGGPALRLAVMGAGREQALDARAKLRSAVETFISRPVEIVIGAGRIDATGTTSIYREAVAHPASRIIEGLVEAARADRDAARGTEETGDASPVHAPAPHAAVIEPKPLPVPAPKNEVHGVCEKEEHASGRAGAGGGLCELVPGLRAIEARCPGSPGVEMAVDDLGRLHLLACDADTRDALGRLYGAQSWARDHLALLLRAEPGLAMPSADRGSESEAVMHLITPEPAAVRELYDTPVRVYALARVRLGRVVAQVATALNG